MALFTPVNQKRLTNVSVVRLKVGGSRYELACYPNKVKAWREKLERDINEVLQVHDVFCNVSKGQLATKCDLLRDFNTDDVDVVIDRILRDGEVQVTVKERKFENENLFRDVAKIVSEKCINPENNRGYTVTMIEKMMRDCHINLLPKRSAKQQALDVIRQLSSSGSYKIAPAMVEVLISLDPDLVDAVSPYILKLVHQMIRQKRNSDGIFEISAVLQPENYHKLSEALNEYAKNKHCIEIIGTAQSHYCSKKAPPQSRTSTISATVTQSISEVSPIAEEPAEDHSASTSAPMPEPEPSPTLEGDISHEDQYEVALRKVKQRKKNRKRKNVKNYGAGACSSGSDNDTK